MKNTRILLSITLALSLLAALPAMAEPAGQKNGACPPAPDSQQSMMAVADQPAEGRGPTAHRVSFGSSWMEDEAKVDKGFGGAFCACTGNYTTNTHYGSGATCIEAWHDTVAKIRAQAQAVCYSLGHDYDCSTFPDVGECTWNGTEYTDFGFAHYGCGSFC